MLPSISAWKMSGYWLAEWLPQMLIFLTELTGRAALAANWATARLWSRRVMAVNWPGFSFGALRMAMRALVLAGLPTTSTLTAREAESDRALPCTVKMAPLAESRSARSMPALRGMAPTSRA